jgi:hypothetical protein
MDGLRSSWDGGRVEEGGAELWTTRNEAEDTAMSDSLPPCAMTSRVITRIATSSHGMYVGKRRGGNDAAGAMTVQVLMMRYRG